MTQLFAIYGRQTKDILTWGGQPIVHTNRYEMEWLMPGAIVVQVTERDLRDRSPLPPLRLRDHPGLAHLTWPLRREDFQ